MFPHFDNSYSVGVRLFCNKTYSIADTFCNWLSTPTHAPYCRLTLERLNQLEPWISALADEFNEAALQAEAEADDAKKQAKELLEGVERSNQQTDRLRLKGDSRDRRRRSRSRERDRC